MAFADPVCSCLAKTLSSGARKAGATVHDGGTYICIEGPNFSTRAESNIFRSWGVDVIGMTNLPEARLAREAELCYATLALSTDYDCWHEEHDAVTVESVIAVLQSNVEMARQIIRNIAAEASAERSCQCGTALENAVMTSRDLIPPATREKLDVIMGRYLR